MRLEMLFQWTLGIRIIIIPSNTATMVIATNKSRRLYRFARPKNHDPKHTKMKT